MVSIEITILKQMILKVPKDYDFHRWIMKSKIVNLKYKYLKIVLNIVVK